MSETNREFKELPKVEWKNFTVSVMSASSDANLPAKQNAYQVGKMLPELGMDGINGGYSVGGMGSFAEGYKEGSHNIGLSDEEITKHLKGIIYSEKVIGKTLAKERGVNSPATITPTDSLPERAGGIIGGSDVVIAVEGGVGTNIEALLAAQDQWFKERNTENPKPTRPLILIESTNMIEDTIELNENRSKGTIKTLTPHIYVLSGHSNPNIKKQPGELSKATLENDSQMREKLKLLLEYFHLKKEKDSGNPYSQENYQDLEQKLFSNNSEYKVFTIQEKLAAKQTMSGEGEGI